MPTFDLLAEPWIPVVRSDGSPGEMGLRQVLADAPSLREIRDPIPTVEFGIYHLLVALVMDMFELRETPDLEDLLAAGHFDGQRVSAYFDRWGDRFDLFDSQHPFLQTARLEGKEHSVAYLLPAIPSGTNPIHFHHFPEGAFAVSPAAAARLLASMGQFATQGGKSEGGDRGKPPSINGAPPWYVLLHGRSVFETSCLNCCVIPLPQATGNAPPAWRNDAPIPLGTTRQASLLEALTWRPRRVLLLPNAPGHCSLTGAETPSLVRTMRFRSGAAWDFNVTWIDPSAAYRIDAEGPRPLKPTEDKQVWRDIGPLALLQEGEYESERRRVRFERPAVVTQFAGLIRDGVLAQYTELSISVYGLRARRDKVDEWQRESLSLPASLVWRSPFRAQAQLAMDQAERVAACVKYAIKRAYPRDGKGNQAAFDARIAEAQRGYWQALRPDYQCLLQQLADLPDHGGDEQLVSHMTAWQQRVSRTAWAALDRAIGDLDTDADALARQVAARVGFRIAIAGLFTPSSERRARKQRTAASGGAVAADSDTKGGA